MSTHDIEEVVHRAIDRTTYPLRTISEDVSRLLTFLLAQKGKRPIPNIKLLRKTSQGF